MTVEFLPVKALAEKYKVSRDSLTRALRAGRCTGYKTDSLIFIRDDGMLGNAISGFAKRGFQKPAGYLSTFEIAQKYGLAPATVSRCAKKHKAPRTTHKRTLYFKLTNELEEALEKSAKNPKRRGALRYVPASARDARCAFSDADKPLSKLMAIFRRGTGYASGRESRQKPAHHC